jgi:hypothetical protein
MRKSAAHGAGAERRGRISSFVLRHSFVIRHSSFVILYLALVAPAALAQASDVSNEPRDITGIEDLPPPPPPVRWPYWLALGLVGSAGLCYAGWKLGRIRPRPAPLSPDRWALKELDRIAAMGLVEAGQTEHYHTAISDVVRRYLELRFDLHAPQQTTPEFLATMQKAAAIPAEQQALLADFLRRCDVAKFAPVTPPPEECREVLEVARRIIGHPS